VRFEVVVELISSYVMYIRRVKEDVTAVGTNRREIVVRYLSAQGVSNYVFNLVRSSLIHHLPSVVGG